MLKKLGYALVGLVFTASVAAFAAGAFNGFPIVGDTSGTTTCLSYGNNSVCNQYSPAGPADVPLTSVIPADTLSATGQPFTVLIPSSLTGANVFNIVPLTSTNVTVSNGTSKVVMTPAGSIAGLSLTLPPATALLDGQELFFYTNQTITLLSLVAGTGTTITPTVTTLTAAAPVKLLYIQLTSSTGTWQLF